jgi:hypothetical protein
MPLPYFRDCAALRVAVIGPAGRRGVSAKTSGIPRWSIPVKKSPDSKNIKKAHTREKRYKCF